MSKKGRVVVAMSGGVDSSVVAGLLVRRGYDVVGITMQIWQESQTDPRHAGCCSLGAVEDARRVARTLGIPYYVINMRDEFRQTVIQDFLDEYSRGRTPNPCVQCNRHVKFDLLLEKAAQIGYENLATGHYARIRRGGDGRYRLMRARGRDKDQSYAVFMLNQNQLSRLKFPLGELPGKHETRQIARELGLSVADKPDSQDICFVSEAGGYSQFLRKHRPESFKVGELVDTSGRAIGEHGGVGQFTVGQRRRIGANSSGTPLYVLRIEPEKNRVVVGSDNQLWCRAVLFEDVIHAEESRIRVSGKIRYNMQAQKGTLYPGNPSRVVFDEPVRAVTPGQTAVFYRGETVVSGGTIIGGGE